jgi:hypothetical protein
MKASLLGQLYGVCANVARSSMDEHCLLGGDVGTFDISRFSVAS